MSQQVSGSDSNMRTLEHADNKRPFTRYGPSLTDGGNVGTGSEMKPENTESFPPPVSGRISV